MQAVDDGLHKRRGEGFCTCDHSHNLNAGFELEEYEAKRAEAAAQEEDLQQL